MVAEIRELRADEKFKDALLGYYDTVWAPSIAGTRLIYARYGAAGKAWRDRLAGLDRPEEHAPPGAKPKKPVLRVFEQAVHQHRLNMEAAVRAFNGLKNSTGADAAAEKAWAKVGEKSNSFFLAERTLAERNEAHQSDVARWEAANAAYQPQVEYFRLIKARRSELVALIQGYNRMVDYDSPVTKKGSFTSDYENYVPTHHFYKPNTGQGPMYFYVFEQNQMDVHLHLTSRSETADVSLITFKQWGSADHTSPATRGDAYFDGGGVGAGKAAYMDMLVSHLRREYPPVSNQTPQRILPLLPRHPERA